MAITLLGIQNNPSILASLKKETSFRNATSFRKAQLQEGEGTNFNGPPSDEHTSANRLTIIINIPSIWEDSTEEAAAQSRGSDLFSQGKDIYNALNKGEDYLKKGIDMYTPLNADTIVAASKDTLSSNFDGHLKLRSAPIGNIPASGDSEYCAPDCARKQDRKFPTSTPRNARRLNVEPMTGARGFSLGPGCLTTPYDYKHQFDNAYTIAKNMAEYQGRALVSSFGDVGSRSAAISNAQTPEADARGFLVAERDCFNTPYDYKQFYKAYNIAKYMAEKRREGAPSSGGVGSRSAAISNAQTPEADARGFNFSDIDKYKHQFDNAYSTAKNVTKQGHDFFSDFGGVGSRSAPLADAKTPYVSSETDPRGFNFSAAVQAGYKAQFDNTPISEKQVKKEIGFSSNLGDVGSRSAAISNAPISNLATKLEKYIADFDKANRRGMESNLATKLEKCIADFDKANGRKLISDIEKYKHSIDTQMTERGSIFSDIEKYKHSIDTQMAERGHNLINNFGGLGLRSAPIAEAKTPYVSDESDPRGFGFSPGIRYADDYKNQFDKVYNIGIRLAEGHEIYDKFKDVGLRSAAITNQSHGEGYCSPCGKQNASQVDSIKEQLDSAEARDNLLIDQVKQQQQTRRMEVTQMLGNR